jgi:hypothetical protein
MGDVEEVEEREDVCAVCLELFEPEDERIPYGNGYRHKSCPPEK